MTEVEELVLELLERLGLAPRVLILDLRPAGETRTHEVAQSVVRDLADELGDDLRLLGPRPDHGELTPQDVDDLREFVEVRAPQDPTEPRDPHVVRRSPIGGLVGRAAPHRSELEDLEGDAVPTDARLPVEQRPAVRDRIADEHEWRHQRERQQATGCECGVEKALHPRVAHGVELTDVEEQRHSLQLADRDLAQPLLVEHGEGADAHSGLVQRGRLDDHVLLVLRLPAQHDDRRLALTGQVDQR